MAVLLYYPMISAPAPVINQALLYWDGLATIVPPGPPDQFLDSRMREVNAAGLYRPLPVSGGRPEYVPPNEIDDHDVSYQLAALADLVERIPADDLVPGSGPEAYVYKAKLSEEVVEELLRRGLAEELEPFGLRLRISAAIQTRLISVAIREIAHKADWTLHGADVLHPFTDHPSAHLFAHQPRPGSTTWDVRPCWEVEIGGLLPAPVSDVLVSDLLAFRERYDDERRRLMMAIDLLVHGMQRHYSHPETVLRAVKHELEEALADLQAAGRSARIDWVRRSVTLSIAMSSGYAGAEVVPEFGWVLGVVAGAAINVATTSKRRGHRGESRDFSYLYRVQKALESND